MNRAFRYSGSKQHLIKYLNSILPENSDEYFYLECFQALEQYLYSDIENFESDELLNVGFTKIDSKMLRNTCPSSDKSFTKKKKKFYIYSTFKFIIGDN